MPNDLVSRLEDAIGKVLEKNRQLAKKCQQLEAEKRDWQEEKEALLADVEQVLKRFDSLDLEGL